MPPGTPPYLWGVKPENQQSPRKRTAPLLEEMLVAFPDPKNLARPGNKYENIVECMRERHKEQRQRLLDRHMKEFNEWKEDTQKAIDYDSSFKFYFPLTHPTTIMLPESVQLISTPEATAALQRLPASRRNVVVSMEQLVMPKGLEEKESYRYRELSHPEVAAEIAKQGVAMRNRMKKEEQEMRIYQHGAISIFLQALERHLPDKYGKHGSNAQLAQAQLAQAQLAQAQSAPTHRNWPSSFGSRADGARSGDPRRQPAPISIPKGLSSSATPKSALLSAVSDKDIDIRDAPQQVPQIPVAPVTAPLPAQPGISRDPRKPPPPFNPYALPREEIIHSAPPLNVLARREEPLYSNPYGRREEPIPPIGPLNPSGRREGYVPEDIYSRRENVQLQRAVPYSNLFHSKQSPMSPSLPGGRPGQSPASPTSEHSAGHRASIQMSGQGGGLVMVGKDVTLGTNGSRWDVSFGNVDDMDTGEAAWLRRKGMSGNLAR